MSIRTRLFNFYRELKRRKVFHVGSLYLVAAWGASLGASELFPAFGIPDWAVRFFVVTALMGFPLALVLAWAFEITPEGVVVDDGGPNAPSADMSTTVWATNDFVVVSGQLAAGSFSKEFRGEFVIGRDATVDMTIDDPKVSRRHARVFLRNGTWWVSDLGSRNGTQLNGTMIREDTRLGANNTLLLADGGPAIELRVQANKDSLETQLDH